MPKTITASHRHIILDQNQNDICVEGLGCHMHVQHANANKCAKNVAATTLNNQRKNKGLGYGHQEPSDHIIKVDHIHPSLHWTVWCTATHQTILPNMNICIKLSACYCLSRSQHVHAEYYMCKTLEGICSRATLNAIFACKKIKTFKLSHPPRPKL